MTPFSPFQWTIYLLLLFKYVWFCLLGFHSRNCTLYEGAWYRPNTTLRHRYIEILLVNMEQKKDSESFIVSESFDNFSDLEKNNLYRCTSFFVK